MAIKPITISFKNNIEDKDLNEWIIGHSNYSGFIKDLLRKEMKGLNIIKIVSKTETKDNKTDALIDLNDF